MCLPTQVPVEKEWEHAGLKCAITKVAGGGHRCGYVRVPPGHPAHGKDEDTLDLRAHGGVNFAALEPCKHDDGQGWWFGFTAVFRSLDYVTKECESLAAQLAKLT